MASCGPCEPEQPSRMTRCESPSTNAELGSRRRPRLCRFSVPLLLRPLSRRHTPATVLARVTELLLAKVKPGGLALMRAPTQHRHYQFMLPKTQELAELDVIPQWKLFELLEENAFSLIFVQEDLPGGRYSVSHDTGRAPTIASLTCISQTRVALLVVDKDRRDLLWGDVKKSQPSQRGHEMAAIRSARHSIRR